MIVSSRAGADAKAADNKAKARTRGSQHQDPTKMGWRTVFENPVTALCRHNYIAYIIIACVGSLGTNLFFYWSRSAWKSIPFTNIKCWGLDADFIFTWASDLTAVVSRLAGINWVCEIRPEYRLWALVVLYGICFVGTILFVVLPIAAKPIGTAIIGVGVGVQWPLSYAAVDGRRFSGLVGSIMSFSIVYGTQFADIVSTSLAPTVGQDAAPIVTSIIGFIPFAILLFLAESMPEPSKQDIAQRGERKPMTKETRRAYLKKSGMGVVMMALVDLLFVTYGDMLRNFAPGILAAWGLAEKPAFAEWIEVVASVCGCVPCGLFCLVKSRVVQFCLYTVQSGLMNIVMILMAALGQIEVIGGGNLYLLLIFFNYWAHQPFESVVWDNYLSAFNAEANSALLLGIGRAVVTGESLVQDGIVGFWPKVAPSWTISSFCTVTGIIAFAGLAVNVLQMTYQLWFI